MRLLVIDGDGDFDVVSWQESGLSIDDTVSLVEKTEDNCYWSEDGDWMASILSFPFTVSDQDSFDSFLFDIKNDFMDYDSLKSKDLFLIKENK